MNRQRPLFLACLLLAAAALMAQQGDVPAYHAGPPAKGTVLPPILSQERLWGADFQYPYQRHAYELAAKIPNVLYQQPCYCYCDRMGHRSLHSCFESSHAAECGVCLKELYYTYQSTREGRTPRQIRAGIIRGDWKQIDLENAATIQ